MNLPKVSLETLSTVGIGAAIAAVVAGWQQVKGFLNRLVGILVTTSEFRDMAADGARIYCAKNLRTFPSAHHVYLGGTRFLRPLARYGLILYEAIGKGGVFWYGRIPIWVTDKYYVAEASKASNVVSFRYLRGTLDPDKLAWEISTTTTTQQKVFEDRRFRVIRLAGRSGKHLMNAGEAREGMTVPSAPAGGISLEGGHRLVGWKQSDIGETEPESDPLERLALTPEVEEVVSEIKRWYASKDWYTKRQISWRFGALFLGQPGTGKSSLVKAMAQNMNLPIYLLDISTMDNEEFHDSYQTALRNTPAIVLIEDIDAVFNKRENIAAEKGKGLTFDCFLNIISGVENSDGILLMVTTNHIEMVDDALGVPQAGSGSSRPGRIDRAVELPILNEAGRRKLATRIMSGCHESWVEYLTREGEDDTGAQFEDRCGTAALNLYWSNNPKKPAPHINLEVA